MFKRVFHNDNQRRQHIQSQLQGKGFELADCWIEELVKRGIVGGQVEDDFLFELCALTDEARKRRFQAVDIFPFLKELPYKARDHDIQNYREMTHDFYDRPLTSHQKKYNSKLADKLEEDVKIYRKVLDAVDNAEPLNDALVQFAHDLGIASIRLPHIKRMASAEQGVKNLQDFKELETATSMKIDVFPNTNRKYRAHFHFHYNLSLAFNERVYSYSAGLGVTHSNKWDPFDSLLRHFATTFKSGDYDKIIRLANANSLENFVDSLGWLQNTVIAPLVREHDFMEEAYAIFGDDLLMNRNFLTYAFLKEATAVDLAEFNLFWHKNYARIANVLKDYDDNLGHKIVQEWAEKFPKADSHDIAELNQYTIVPLLSRAQLDHTSEILGDICISGDPYPANSIQGISFCFAVQDLYGMTCSAFELNAQGELVQHEAFGGSEPEEDQVASVKHYLNAIADGRLTPNKLYNEWLEKAQNFTFREIHGHSEYDPDRARLALKTMLSIPGLPKSFKRMLNDHVNWRSSQSQQSRLIASAYQLRP